MSKKSKRRKNNQARRDFKKNVMLQEEREAINNIGVDEMKNDFESAEKDLPIEKEEKVFEKNILDENAEAETVDGEERLAEVKKDFEKIKLKAQEWKEVFWAKMTSQKNLKRDIVAVIVIILLAIWWLSF